MNGPIGVAPVENQVNFGIRFLVHLQSHFRQAMEAAGAADTSDVEDEVHPLLEKYVMKWLVSDNVCHSLDALFRQRSCQLISMLMKQLPETTRIEVEMYETIRNKLVRRMKDKVPAIRRQAVLALERFQDPSNQECPVVAAYLFHLERDPNWTVRKAVLEVLFREYT
jgi:condensin complex subunit 3